MTGGFDIESLSGAGRPEDPEYVTSMEFYRNALQWREYAWDLEERVEALESRLKRHTRPRLEPWFSRPRAAEVTVSRVSASRPFRCDGCSVCPAEMPCQWAAAIIPQLASETVETCEKSRRRRHKTEAQQRRGAGGFRFGVLGEALVRAGVSK